MLAATTEEKSTGGGMSRRGSREATTPQTSQNRGIFGCHHLNNTTPTFLTPQTSPHAVCWLYPLLGCFSYVFCGQDYLESDLSMPTLRVSWAFQLQSQTAQLSAHEQPCNNKLVTSWLCPPRPHLSQQPIITKVKQ